MDLPCGCGDNKLIKNYLKVYNKKFYKTNSWKIKRQVEEYVRITEDYFLVLTAFCGDENG